jgi:hypothetical protein
MTLVNLWKARQLASANKLSKMLFKWRFVNSSEKGLLGPSKAEHYRISSTPFNISSATFPILLHSRKVDPLNMKKKTRLYTPRFAKTNSCD